MDATLEPTSTPGAASISENWRNQDLIGIALFGIASVFLFIACMVWPAGGLWGPGVSTTIAWLIFGLHLLLVGRRMGAFDPLLWVPVLILLHYLGMPLAIHVLGQNSTYDGWNLGTPPKLTLGAATALLSHVSLIFGFHLRGIRNLGDRPPVPSPDERSIAGPAVTMLAGSFLMLMIGLIIAGPELIFGSYKDLKTSEKFGLADLRFFSSGFIFGMGGVYGVVASHVAGRNKPLLVFTVAGSAALAALLILTGDRTGLSVLCIAGGWALTQRVARVPRWIAVTGFVGALVLMPIIKEFRVHRDVQDAQTRSVLEQISATAYEMGTSLQAFCYTIDRIPSEKPYNLGVSTLNQVLAGVPNLGFTTGGLQFGFGVDNNPSKWLTKTANPVKFARNAGGYAFALGAEWYFNFGMIGVFLGMTLTGFVCTAVRNNARRSPMWLTFSCLFLGMMLMLVRNDLAYPLRTMMWPMIGYGALLGLWRLLFGVRHPLRGPPAPFDPQERETATR